METLIVAEIGLNHMGSESYADRHLAALCASGVDAVTLQVQDSAFYAKSDVHRALALSDEYYNKAARYLHSRDTKFGITLSNKNKLSMFERTGVDFYKILSKDIGNEALISSVLATGKPVYVSTGMSDEEEVVSVADRYQRAPNLRFIHTALSYDDADTNLRAISRLQGRTGAPVAFGLHSTMPAALYASMAFEPAALFFYVKGSEYKKHRDEEHALPWSQCHEVVNNVCRIRAMMGDGRKKKMQNRITDQK